MLAEEAAGLSGTLAKANLSLKPNDETSKRRMERERERELELEPRRSWARQQAKLRVGNLPCALLLSLNLTTSPSALSANFQTGRFGWLLEARLEQSLLRQTNQR